MDILAKIGLERTLHNGQIVGLVCIADDTEKINKGKTSIDVFSPTHYPCSDYSRFLLTYIHRMRVKKNRKGARRAVKRESEDEGRSKYASIYQI